MLDNMLVQISLDLKTKDNSVTLVSKTYNGLNHSIYLPPNRLPFTVVEQKSGLELPVLGLQINRIPYHWNEFIEIKAKTTYKEVFKINDLIALAFDCQNYQLFFNKGYFYPNQKTFYDLGEEKLDFSWCNPVDHYKGRWSFISNSD